MGRASRIEGARHESMLAGQSETGAGQLTISCVCIPVNPQRQAGLSVTPDAQVCSLSVPRSWLPSSAPGSRDSYLTQMGYRRTEYDAHARKTPSTGACLPCPLCPHFLRPQMIYGQVPEAMALLPHQRFTFQSGPFSQLSNQLLPHSLQTADAQVELICRSISYAYGNATCTETNLARLCNPFVIIVQHVQQSPQH